MKARTNTERLLATGIAVDVDAPNNPWDSWGDPSVIIPETYTFASTGTMRSKVHLARFDDLAEGGGSALCGVGVEMGSSQHFVSLIDGGGEHKHPGLCRKCLLALERETANAP